MTGWGRVSFWMVKVSRPARLNARRASDACALNSASTARTGPPETRKCHDSIFSASSRRSNRVTGVTGTRPNAFRATNRSKIGDTDPEHSLFPDTCKMLLASGSSGRATLSGQNPQTGSFTGLTRLTTQTTTTIQKSTYYMSEIISNITH